MLGRWRRIRVCAGLDGVRIHDLIHTYAFWALAMALKSFYHHREAEEIPRSQTNTRWFHLVKSAGNRIASRIAEVVQ